MPKIQHQLALKKKKAYEETTQRKRTRIGDGDIRLASDHWDILNISIHNIIHQNCQIHRTVLTYGQGGSVDQNIVFILHGILYY